MAAFPPYDCTSTSTTIIQVDCATATISTYTIPSTVASNYTIRVSTPDYLVVYGKRFLRSQYEQAKIYANECWSRIMWRVPRVPVVRSAHPIARPVLKPNHRRLVRMQAQQNKRRFARQRIRARILKGVA